MTANSLILELLDDVKPGRRCDDCLSEELGITPRQTVNQICRSLESKGRISRTKTVCDGCGKSKICNGRGGAVSDVIMASLSDASSHCETSTHTPDKIDIEKARTEIVRICRQVWREGKVGEPPRSISLLINSLRNDGLLPAHQANMMLTLCGLRNVYVYEGIELGQKESLIARSAQDIVTEWWVNAPSRKR